MRTITMTMITMTSHARRFGRALDAAAFPRASPPRRRRAAVSGCQPRDYEGRCRGRPRLDQGHGDRYRRLNDG
jgi:hypothetical protein